MVKEGGRIFLPSPLLMADAGKCKLQVADCGRWTAGGEKQMLDGRTNDNVMDNDVVMMIYPPSCIVVVDWEWGSVDKI
jgi:hypothetical protein